MSRKLTHLPSSILTKHNKFLRERKRKRKELEDPQAQTLPNFVKHSQNIKKKYWKKMTELQLLHAQINHGKWIRSLLNLLHKRNSTSPFQTMQQERHSFSTSCKKKEWNSHKVSQSLQLLMLHKVLQAEMYLSYNSVQISYW
jgi:hypothetical protein